MLEYPYNMGNTVYRFLFLKNGMRYIVGYKVVGFYLEESPNSRRLKRIKYLFIHNEATNTTIRMDIKELGKTVFLTREEAEKAIRMPKKQRCKNLIDKEF